MGECAYLGDTLSLDVKGVRIEDAHECRYFDRCSLSDTKSGLNCCSDCAQRLELTDPDFPSKWEDPLLVVDRRRRPTKALRDLVAGGSAFLVCGGPSAEPYLDRLNSRGCFSLAVNNAAGKVVRPQAMVFSDPPSKFSHSIWLDKSIMKLCPMPKMRGRRAKLRRKVGGEFVQMEEKVPQMPNVWGFRRWSWMTPDEQFFLTGGACWGNHQAGVDKTGQPKTVCTMLLGLRLLYYLGAKRIFMVGVDFRMSPDYGYSFDQERTQNACDSNNAQFRVVNHWLCTMQQNGTFQKFGLEIYNCYERSGLRAFAFVPFDEAWQDVVGGVEQAPDLSRWYDK